MSERSKISWSALALILATIGVGFVTREWHSVFDRCVGIFMLAIVLFPFRKQVSA